MFHKSGPRPELDTPVLSVIRCRAQAMVAGQYVSLNMVSQPIVNMLL